MGVAVVAFSDEIQFYVKNSHIVAYGKQPLKNVCLVMNRENPGKLDRIPDSMLRK